MPLITACALGLVLSCRVADAWCDPAVCLSVSGGTLVRERDEYGDWPACQPVAHWTVRPLVPGGEVLVQAAGGPVTVWAFPDPDPGVPVETRWMVEGWGLKATFAGGADIDCSGEVEDRDVDLFFQCLAGSCCPTCNADWDRDGDTGTDADLTAFLASWLGRAK